METKEFVGMFNCPLCKEPMGLLLDRRMKKSLHKNNIIGPELCDKCIEKLKEAKQVVIYETKKCISQENAWGPMISKNDYISGKYMIVNENSFELDEDSMKKLLECRFIFAAEEDFTEISSSVSKEAESKN